MKSFKEDEEFKKEYFELLQKYRRKHEAEYYKNLYEKIFDTLGSFKPKGFTDEDLHPALDCFGYMNKYGNMYFLDPTQPIIYFIKDNKLHKIDNVGIEVVTITPDLFEYFCKSKFIDVVIPDELD